MPGMLTIHAAAKQVEAQPAWLIFELGLVGQGRRAENLSEILRLNELSIRPQQPDCTHCKHHRLALIDGGPEKAAHVAAVRIPMSVEATKARRRQRLIHGGKQLDPGITRGDALCMARKQERKKAPPTVLGQLEDLTGLS